MFEAKTKMNISTQKGLTIGGATENVPSHSACFVDVLKKTRGL